MLIAEKLRHLFRKKSSLCRIIGIMTRCLSMMMLLFLLAITSLFIRLKQEDISLDFILPYLMHKQTFTQFTLNINHATLGLENDSMLKPKIFIDTLQVIEKKNTDNQFHFQNIRLSMSVSQLFLGKIYPKEMITDKATIHYHSQSSEDKDNAQIDFNTLYQTYFKTGPLKHLKHLEVKHIDTVLALPDTLKGSLVMRQTALNIWHDRKDERLDLEMTGKIKTDFIENDAIVKNRYQASTQKLHTKIWMNNVRSIDKNIYGITGKGDLYLALRQNATQNIEFIKTHLKQFTGTIAPDKEILEIPVHVHQADIIARYYPTTKRSTLDIKTLHTNQGTIKGQAFLEKDAFDIWQLEGNLQANQFNLQHYWEKPITIKNIQLGLSFEEKKGMPIQEIRLKTFKMNAENAHLNAEMLYQKNTELTEKSTLQSHIDFKNLTPENLVALWPIKTPGTARAWLQDNLKQMKIDQGTINLKHDFSQNFPQINASIPFKEGKFFYRAPMSAIEQASGILTLQDKTFTAKINKGVLNGLTITAGTFTIPDIVANIPMGKSHMRLKGNVENLNQVLDQEPLFIFKNKNIDYQGKKGTLIADMNLSLPLLSSVDFDDVHFDGNVKINKADIDLQSKNYRLTDFTGTIDFTDKGLESKFTTWVNDVKQTGTWREDFAPKKEGITTDVQTKSMITHENLKNFGIDLTDYWHGVAPTDLSLKLKSGVVHELTASLQADKSKIMLPYSLYTEKAGSPKKITLNATQQGKDFVIKNFDLAGKKTQISLRDMRIQDNHLVSAEILSLDTAGAIEHGTGKYFLDSNQHPRLRLKAKTIYAETFLNYDPPLPAANTPKQPYNPLILNVDTDKAIMSNTKTIKNVNFSAFRPEGKQFLYHIDGNLGGRYGFRVRLKRVDNHLQNFSFFSPNAGGFLKAYDSFYYLKNGTLKIEGTTEKKAQGQDSMITGNIFINNGTLMNAPTVAKIFSLASLTGIVDRLTDEGLDMDKIKTDFIKQGDKVILNKGVVAGSAVGFSYHGFYNSTTGVSDIKGTLIPVYEINSFISHVPLLGDLLASKENEGILGMSYTYKGTMDKPKVKIYPLSVLTPGILRRIFD